MPLVACPTGTEVGGGAGAGAGFSTGRVEGMSDPRCLEGSRFSLMASGG